MMYDMQGRIILSIIAIKKSLFNTHKKDLCTVLHLKKKKNYSLLMHDIILFKNFRTRRREAYVFRNLHSGDLVLKTCVFSVQKRRLLGR